MLNKHKHNYRKNWLYGDNLRVVVRQVSSILLYIIRAAMFIHSFIYINVVCVCVCLFYNTRQSLEIAMSTKLESVRSATMKDYERSAKDDKFIIIILNHVIAIIKSTVGLFRMRFRRIKSAYPYTRVYPKHGSRSASRSTSI